MELIIVIISILIITFATWLLRKYLSLKICPICVGVALTWIWLLVGMKLNLLSTVNYQLPVAILMGGTVVGLMSKLEQFVNQKFILIWKTIFVASGFSAVYGLINTDWTMFAVGAILAVVVTFVLKTRGVEPEKQESEQVKKLKEKMKNCC